jgi:hypothetical protein
LIAKPAPLLIDSIYETVLSSAALSLFYLALFLSGTTKRVEKIAAPAAAAAPVAAAAALV